MSKRTSFRKPKSRKVIGKMLQTEKQRRKQQLITQLESKPKNFLPIYLFTIFSPFLLALIIILLMR